MLWESLSGRHPFWQTLDARDGARDRAGRAAARDAPPRPAEAAPRARRPGAVASTRSAAPPPPSSRRRCAAQRRRGGSRRSRHAAGLAVPAEARARRRGGARRRVRGLDRGGAALLPARLGGRARARRRRRSPRFRARARSRASRSPSPSCRSGTSRSGSPCSTRALAAAWIVLSWREPRGALLFVLGPLLAPLARPRARAARSRRGCAPARAVPRRPGSRCSRRGSSPASAARRSRSPAPRRRSGSGSAGSGDPFDVAGTLARAAAAQPALLARGRRLRGDRPRAALRAGPRPLGRGRGRRRDPALLRARRALRGSRSARRRGLGHDRRRRPTGWTSCIDALGGNVLPHPWSCRAIEQKIEALFEGVFGRAFRTNVQPVELARKLAKEMDDHKTRLRLARLRPERVHRLSLDRRP